MFGNTNKELEKAFEQPTVSGHVEPVVMLPCPFCGGEARMEREDDTQIYGCEIICSSCGAGAKPEWAKNIFDKEYDVVARAKSNWNKRVT